jgi:hypothetical protein
MSGAAMMLRARQRVRGVSAPPSGQYARFAPIYATAPRDGITGLPMTFNSSTGIHDGTVMDTTEPVWGTTVALSDSGNAATNATALQSAIDTAVATQTSNTLITIPATATITGQILLRRNTTGFWVGLQTANRESLPALSDGTHIGTKANRVSFESHAALMPEITTAGNGVTAIASQPYECQQYYFRGLRFTNPSGFSSRWVGMSIIAGELLGGGGGSLVFVTNATSTTVKTAFDGPSAVDGLIYLQRGTGAGQARRITAYNETDGYTVTPAWDVVPDTTSCAVAFARPFGMAEWDSATFDIFKAFPQNMVFAQCLFDGNAAATNSMQRSLALGGENMAVIDCYFRDTGRSTQQAQDVFIDAGRGPYKLTNNRYGVQTAGRMCIMPGGLSLWGNQDEHLPENIEVRGNVFPPCLGASQLGSFEVKFGSYGLLEKNYFEASGFNPSGGILIKLIDQGGPNQYIRTEHWIVNANWLVGCTSGINFAVTLDTEINRINSCDAVNNIVALPMGMTGTFTSQFTMTEYYSYMGVRYNTFVSSDLQTFPINCLIYGGVSDVAEKQGTNQTWEYNVMARNITGGWFTMNKGPGTWATTGNLTDSVCRDNLINNNRALSEHPNDIRVDGTYDDPLIGFVDRAGGNYNLAPTSLGYQADPSGFNLGCDFALISSLMEDVY